MRNRKKKVVAPSARRTRDLLALGVGQSLEVLIGDLRQDGFDAKTRERVAEYYLLSCTPRNEQLFQGAEVFRLEKIESLIDRSLIKRVDDFLREVLSVNSTWPTLNLKFDEVVRSHVGAQEAFEMCPRGLVEALKNPQYLKAVPTHPTKQAIEIVWKFCDQATLNLREMEHVFRWRQ